MPELPEVHTIVEDIKKYVVGAKIVDATIYNNYKTSPTKEVFVKQVKETEILGSQRVAKNIVLELSNEKYILMHLAMTGNLLLRSPNQANDRWNRVTFHLSKNSREMQLRFCDMRMFGKVSVLTKETVTELKSTYGPSPLNKDLTPQKFLANLQKKKTNIKNALLDQTLVAGLGNVYATDTLWIAQISPELRTQKLNLFDAQKLLEASREILAEGIKNRGISMSDYVDLLGKKGQQQNHFRVYSKKNCSRCNTAVAFKKLNGRGTYYCPNCQK